MDILVVFSEHQSLYRFTETFLSDSIVNGNKAWEVGNYWYPAEVSRVKDQLRLTPLTNFQVVRSVNIFGELNPHREIYTDDRAHRVVIQLQQETENDQIFFSYSAIYYASI